MANLYDIKFKGEHTIYQQVVKCTVKENEMNASYNPSLKKVILSESSSLQDFATGSYFNPYATTIGLYNDKNELLAIAKFAKPIPISSNSDTTFLIKIDL